MKDCQAYLTYVAIVIAMAATACTFNKSSEAKISDDSSISDGKLVLELPSIPVAISEPEDRAGFLAVHFWDGLDFSDRDLALNMEFMERNFVDFIGMLPSVIGSDRLLAFESLLRQAAVMPEGRSLIMALGHKYFHHPSSPMRNDEYYGDFLKASKNTVTRQTPLVEV